VILIFSTSHVLYLSVSTWSHELPPSMRELVDAQTLSCWAAVRVMRRCGWHSLRTQVVGQRNGSGISHDPEDFPGDVALEAAHDLAFAFSFAGAFADVVSGALTLGHAHQSNAVNGRIRVPVSAAESLWRVVFPEDAGIGATPGSAAN
jgi:hypothetical protein